jgi:hypothetical protein
MSEVILELISRQMQAGHDELKVELAAMREEQARTNEKVAAIARSLVGVQPDLHCLHRDMETLKDPLTFLTVAADEHPPHTPESPRQQTAPCLS